MNDHAHTPFEGFPSLYALGALSEEERTAFEGHLEVCLECVNEVKSLLPVAQRLLHLSAPLEPSAALRGQVLKSSTGTEPPLHGGQQAPVNVGEERTATGADRSTRSSSVRRGGRAGFWSAAILLIGIAAAGGWYAAGLMQRIGRLEGELARRAEQHDILEVEIALARATVAEREQALAVVTTPGVQQLALAGQPLAPRASARAVWAETALVFLASELPVLPTGDVYQLWFVTPGDPVSGGFLTPDAEGSLRAMVNIPDSVTMPTAMAITLEPAGGVRAPTGEVYLLGQPVTQ